jgi:hypothetical protein
MLQSAGNSVPQAKSRLSSALRLSLMVVATAASPTNAKTVAFHAKGLFIAGIEAHRERRDKLFTSEAVRKEEPHEGKIQH